MVRYDVHIRQHGDLRPARCCWRVRLVAGGLALALGMVTVAIAAPVWAASDVSAAVENGTVREQSAPTGNRLNGLFGTREFVSSNPAVVPQWDQAIGRIERDRAIIDACDADPAACPSSLRGWRQAVESLRGADPLTQLREINVVVNQAVPYRSDADIYGTEDYWASPLESLRGAGDCEDYAIMKFVSLLDLGFRNDQMRIVVVDDTVRDLPHAVLVVELAGTFYLLDNQIDEVLPLHRVSRYVPRYSVNLTRHWAHVVVAALSNGVHQKSAKTSEMELPVR